MKVGVRVGLLQQMVQRTVATRTIRVRDFQRPKKDSAPSASVDKLKGKEEEDGRIHARLLNDHSKLRHDFDDLSSKLKETSTLLEDSLQANSLLEAKSSRKTRIYAIANYYVPKRTV